MFNFLKPLSKDKNLTEDTNIKDNAISFCINKKSLDPYLKINIVNTDTNQAEAVSQMLFQICSGLYQYDITKTIIDMSKEDLEINLFMQQCLVKWVSLLNSNNRIKENPIVSPSQFSQSVK
jgi:hypothetical protein